MEELQQLLQGERNQTTATRIKALYNQLTGQQINVGCFCKSNNVNKVFQIAEQWLAQQ